MYKKTTAIVGLSTLILLICYSPSIAAVSVDPPSAQIIIQARKNLEPVNRQLFGQNFTNGNGSELWDFKNDRPAQRMVSLLRALRPGVLRYPGGGNVSRFLWKQAVEPTKQREKPYRLGVPEFLAVCKIIGAKPDITINMTQTPTDAANLVEYLNAPATADHPWAMKRKAWGHPDPYNVTYFEMGNENYYDVTPKEYAADFRATAKAMRAVDPSIKLGFVTSPLIHPLHSDWNITVMKKIGSIADFAIVHNYPGWYSHESPDIAKQKKLMRSIMASAEQSKHRIGMVHQMMKEYIGHDLPIAVTEYNAGFVQEKPKPLRFSLGAALFSADYIRMLLLPSTEVKFATYWHFLNGYWGMIRTPARTHAEHLQIMPAYLMFRLWGQHFGDELIKTKVTGPTLTFSGRLPITWPAIGDHYQAPTPISTKNLVGQIKLQSSSGKGFDVKIRGENAINVTLHNYVGPNNPALATFTHDQDILPANVSAYRVTFEARYLSNSGSTRPSSLGLQLTDIRGWKYAAIMMMGAQTTRQWKQFQGILNLPLNAPGGVKLAVRMKANDEPVSGTLQIRNIAIIPCHRETYPAYAALTAAASLSTDGHTLSLMVFNKTIDQPISTQIKLQGFAAVSAKQWTVNAPNNQGGLDTMTGSKAVLTAKAKPLTVTANGSTTTIELTFPAHSMTAIELVKNSSGTTAENK